MSKIPPVPRHPAQKRARVRVPPGRPDPVAASPRIRLTHMKAAVFQLLRRWEVLKKHLRYLKWIWRTNRVLVCLVSYTHSCLGTGYPAVWLTQFSAGYCARADLACASALFGQPNCRLLNPGGLWRAGGDWSCPSRSRRQRAGSPEQVDAASAHVSVTRAMVSATKYHKKDLVLHHSLRT